MQWLEISILLGSFFGLPITNYLVDKIGRKISLLLAGCIEIISWTTIAFAPTIDYIIAMRFLFGIASNVLYVAAPMYVAEIADQQFRGVLSILINVIELLGTLTVYSLGPYFSFTVPCFIGAGISAFAFLTFLRMPETPVYLIYKNKHNEAKKSLQFFQPSVDADKELKIIAEVHSRQECEPSRRRDIFLVPSNRKAVLIMGVLNIGQHFSAYSVILMNMHSILQAANSVYMNPECLAILFATLMLIASVVASYQMDKYGRRFLIILSSLLTGICLIMLGVYFHLNYMGYNMLQISWLPIVSVMVYAAVFKIGLGNVPVVIAAEIFSTNHKAFGMTISDAMFLIGGIISIQLYQLLKPIGMFIPFYIFAVCSWLLTLFGFLWMPETKGKTLEEIQQMLRTK